MYVQGYLQGSENDRVVTIEVSGNLWPTAFCSICISGLNNSHCVAEDQTCKNILHVAKIITY